MEEKQNWTYCVVGNIKKTHFDEDGMLRYGTAAFTGGTKVYISGGSGVVLEAISKHWI